MKSRRSVRAPLAPLHSNSLHAGSPRVQEGLAKRETKKSAAEVDSKASTKSVAVAKTSKPSHKQAQTNQKASRSTTSQTSRGLSPARTRKTRPLAANNLQANSGAQTSRAAPPARHASLISTTQPRHTQTSSRSTSADAQHTFTPAAGARATAVTATPANASPGVLSHWHTPGTQPHLDAILVPLDTPAASRRDTMYIPAPKGTPASTVQGAGTPQDFSDVFDLESVSGRTPGGRATFAGRRDSTPGLILDSSAIALQHQQEQSLHSWLASSPSSTRQGLHAHSIRPKLASPTNSDSASSASTANLATPASTQGFKGLRIKTPQHAQHGSASTLLRSSPFLAQLLRTAPSLSPSPSVALASPSSASRVVLRVPSAPCSPESSVTSSAELMLDQQLAPSSSMESAGSNALAETASGDLQVCSPECVTPQLSESAAESAIREALVRLASSEKVIRLASPVDLDASTGTNPHAALSASGVHGLPTFTLAALDSPPAPTALTRQDSGSVNGPEAQLAGSSPQAGPMGNSPAGAASPQGQASSAPFQEVVQQLLSSPKLAITGADNDADKTPYQTLLQHLMGGAAPSSPRVVLAAPGAAAPLCNVLCPAIQATPARHRLAQATYRTPSTAATGPDGISPAAASFQGFACSPVSDQASPLATFLHHLSHATYEAAPAAGTTPSFAAAPSTAAVAAELAGKEDKPEAQAAVPADAANNDVQQVDSTPYQDFMKFLTQATYHSPGTKCDAGSQGLPLRPQAVQSNNLKQHEQGSISGTPDVRPLTVRTGRSTTVAVTPLRLGEDGLKAWLRRSQADHLIPTPARHQLQEVWRHAGEAQQLRQLSQETGSVKEENVVLRGQLLDIQASLAQLTTSSLATTQEAEEHRQIAEVEAGKAKQAAQQLLALAHSTGKVTEAYEVERRALKSAVAEAQQRLRQAEAASKAADAATDSQKAALSEALHAARQEVQKAEAASEAKTQQLAGSLQDKAALQGQLQLAEQQLAEAQAAVAAVGHQKDQELSRLASQLKEAHEALHEFQTEQEHSFSSLTADLTHFKQDNERLSNAIADAQQQLREAASAAAEQALAQQAACRAQHTRLALEEAHQQALQEAHAAQQVQGQEKASLLLQLQEARAQLAQSAGQAVSLQIAVVDDSSRPVTALVTPAKPSAGLQHTGNASTASTPCSKSGRPDSMVATPQAAAAAAQLLRGLNSTQEVALGIEYGLEPEWPPCPPSSLSTSPFAAYGLGSPESVLAAKVSRSSSLGLDAVPRKLESHLTSYETASQDVPSSTAGSLASVAVSPQQSGASPQHLRAPAPTPISTPLHSATKTRTPASLSLSAESICTAFELAHEQLRTPAVKQSVCSSSYDALSPVVTALSRLNAAASQLRTPSTGSPAVKTTRQVPSVLAAVAQLEAAQQLEGRSKLRLPAQVDNSKFQTPCDSQPAAPLAVAAANLNSVSAHAVPAVTQLANPLFSPAASASRAALTPFFTPLGLEDIRLNSCVTPVAGSKLAWDSSTPLDNGSIQTWRENLAGRLGSPIDGTAVPATPGSGVITVGWRSVTERLQTLRVQLQSAQKKLASTAQPHSALMAQADAAATHSIQKACPDSQTSQLEMLTAQAATPGAATSTLSDVTARHQQQPLPAVPPHTGNQPSSQSDATGPQADAAQQSDIKEHVQEQCMSAKGWLRGLVEDRHMTSQTPAKHSPMPTSLPAVQGCGLLSAGYDSVLQTTPRVLMSHPVPTSPSVWDDVSVVSSPARPDHIV